jgi:hypothetical protein
VSINTKVKKRIMFLPRAIAGGRSGPPPPLMAPQAKIYRVCRKWCMIWISCTTSHTPRKPPPAELGKARSHA